MNAYMQKRKNIGICFAFEAKLFCCFFSEETSFKKIVLLQKYVRTGTFAFYKDSSHLCCLTNVWGLNTKLYVNIII